MISVSSVGESSGSWFARLRGRDDQSRREHRSLWLSGLFRRCRRGVSVHLIKLPSHGGFPREQARVKVVKAVNWKMAGGPEGIVQHRAYEDRDFGTPSFVFHARVRQLPWLHDQSSARFVDSVVRSSKAE